jgi:hypothetical protein
MIRSLALMAASAALAIAPVAAQAAPQRTSAPVSAESEALRGNPVIIIALIALLVALGIIALSDGNDPVSP